MLDRVQNLSSLSSSLKHTQQSHHDIFVIKKQNIEFLGSRIGYITNICFNKIFYIINIIAIKLFVTIIVGYY